MCRLLPAPLSYWPCQAECTAASPRPYSIAVSGGFTTTGIRTVTRLNSLFITVLKDTLCFMISCDLSLTTFPSIY